MSGQGLSTERIYKLLRTSPGFVSSQNICRELGVSRAAVWKQVEALRKKGFRIEGVSALGYRLLEVPDSLGVLTMEPGIRTLRLGKTVRFMEETGSTNEDLWGLAQNGAPEGTVVVADAQRAGRGRRGRRWESPGGKNLYLSILLRPPFPPVQAPLITLMAAVSVCRAMVELWGLEPGIKWPNDILLAGKKVGGILAEMQAEQDVIGFLVLGIGVNLNMPLEMFPPELLYPATSVAIELRGAVSRLEFARRVIESLDRCYDELLQEGGGPMLEQWMRYCAHPEALLEVRTPGGSLRGTFTGLDAQGAMILQVDGCRQERVHAGDVIRVGRPNGEG